MTTKVKLHIDKKSYKKKPTKEQTTSIHHSIVKSVSEVTAAEIAQLVGNEGKTMLLATMNGSRKEHHMIQQQVLALDFDNSEIRKDKNGKTIKNTDGSQKKFKTEGIFYSSLEEILQDPFVKENAAFAYKSMSHKSDWEKFRVVFILDKPLTTNEQVGGAYVLKMMELFPTADKNTKDSSRLFYGGIGSIEINFDNIMKTKGLKELKKEDKPPAKQAKNTPKVTGKAAKLDKDEVPTWKLIQLGRKDEVAARLSVYQERLHSKVQAVNYLKSIEMTELLGIRFNPFFDIFHYENSPSAGIFKMNDADIYLYKCHSESKPFTGDIIRVVQQLLEIDYIKAVDYLIEVTGIEIIVTQQVKELRDQCDLYINLVMSKDLKENYPAVHGRFWRYKSDIVAILTKFKENIKEDEDGNITSLTWMSVRSLSVDIYGTERSKDKISEILNLLCYTNWIEKLDDEKIPNHLLKKLKTTQNSNGRSKRSNVFELLLGSDFFTRLNKQCEVMKKEGVTIKTISREGILATSGTDRANQVFVQDKNKGLSEATQEFYSDMCQLADFHIGNNEYFEQNEMLDSLLVKYKSKSYVDRTYKKLLPKLLKEKKLQKKRLTKDLRELWHLPKTQSSPTILCAA